MKRLMKKKQLNYNVLLCLKLFLVAAFIMFRLEGNFGRLLLSLQCRTMSNTEYRMLNNTNSQCFTSHFSSLHFTRLVSSRLVRPLSYICIYIYIYVCVCVCVLFGPVKPEFGVIPSGQKKKRKKTFNSEHSNFPGKELNVTDILVFLIYIKTHKRMEINL